MGLMGKRWVVWYLSEWTVRRFGVVAAADALEAMAVAKRRFGRAWSRAREIVPGGALYAVRTGMPDPEVRRGSNREIFSPRLRLTRA